MKVSVNRVAYSALGEADPFSTTLILQGACTNCALDTLDLRFRFIESSVYSWFYVHPTIEVSLKIGTRRP